MPRYKATRQGFWNGVTYDPRPGRRNFVITDKPIKPVPSWLELAKAETPKQKKEREDKDATAMASIKAAKADVNVATFMGTKGSATEVL